MRQSVVFIALHERFFRGDRDERQSVRGVLLSRHQRSHRSQPVFGSELRLLQRAGERLLVDVNIDRFSFFSFPTLLVLLVAAKKVKCTQTVIDGRFDGHHQANVPGTDRAVLWIETRLVRVRRSTIDKLIFLSLIHI